MEFSTLFKTFIRCMQSTATTEVRKMHMNYSTLVTSITELSPGKDNSCVSSQLLNVTSSQKFNQDSTFGILLLRNELTSRTTYRNKTMVDSHSCIYKSFQFHDAKKLQPCSSRVFHTLQTTLTVKNCAWRCMNSTWVTWITEPPPWRIIRIFQVIYWMWKFLASLI